MIPDFIPIEVTAMSIYSAIGFIGMGFALKIMNSRFYKHQEKTNVIEDNLNNMRVDIAETKAILKGISTQLKDFASINKMIIESRLKK